MPDIEKRLLASYGRRRGRRLRPTRQGLIDDLLPTLQPKPEEITEWSKKKLWLEIGFGGGEHLAHQATLYPDIPIIGCEPFINGTATLLALLTSPSPAPAGEGRGGGISTNSEQAACPLPNPPPLTRERGLPNIRIHNDDARPLIAQLPDHALDKVFILYPDPWPKARHHKRRLISTEFLNALARVMKPCAELRLATDHSDYCTWMLERLLSHPQFRWTAKTCDDWLTPWSDWISTRYEQKRLAGMPTYLTFMKC